MSFIFRREGHLVFRKRHGGLLLIMLGVSLVLGACGEEQANSTDTNGNTNLNPALRWLKGIPCRPPCWEGITPGQTTAQEALEILKHSPIISNPRYSPGGSVDWKWQPDNGKSGGDALTKNKDPKQIIYVVRPWIEPFGVKIKLKDVIREYGEPTYARALINQLLKKNSPNHDIYFYWVNLGLQVESVLFYKKSGFNEDLEIRGPNFFIATEEGFRKDYSGIYDKAIAWEGFKNFDFYCWDADKKWCADSD